MSLMLAYGSNSNSEEILKLFDPFIIDNVQQIAKKYELMGDIKLWDLDIDEIVQKVRIKFWRALLQKNIEYPKAYIYKMIIHEFLDSRYKERKSRLLRSDVLQLEISEGTSENLSEVVESVWGTSPSVEEAALRLASQEELRYLLRQGIKELQSAPHQFQAVLQELDEIGANELLRELREELKENFPASYVSLPHMSQHKSHAHRKLRSFLLQRGISSISVLPLRSTEYIVNAGRDIFTSVERLRTEKSQLSLFAIARAEFERDDRAFVGKTYSIQAGISQSKPENFGGEPFEFSVSFNAEIIPFDIFLHASNNIKLTTKWYKHLLFKVGNPEPQLVDFTFLVIAIGHCSLVVSFFHERRWLRTTQIEFDAFDPSKLLIAS